MGLQRVGDDLPDCGLCGGKFGHMTNIQYYNGYLDMWLCDFCKNELANEITNELNHRAWLVDRVK